MGSVAFTGMLQPMEARDEVPLQVVKKRVISAKQRVLGSLLSERSYVKMLSLSPQYLTIGSTLRDRWIRNVWRLESAHSGLLRHAFGAKLKTQSAWAFRSQTLRVVVGCTPQEGISRGRYTRPTVRKDYSVVVIRRHARVYESTYRWNGVKLTSAPTRPDWVRRLPRYKVIAGRSIVPGLQMLRSAYKTDPASRSTAWTTFGLSGVAREIQVTTSGP